MLFDEFLLSKNQGSGFSNTRSFKTIFREGRKSQIGISKCLTVYLEGKKNNPTNPIHFEAHLPHTETTLNNFKQYRLFGVMIVFCYFFSDFATPTVSNTHRTLLWNAMEFAFQQNRLIHLFTFVLNHLINKMRSKKETRNKQEPKFQLNCRLLSLSSCHVTRHQVELHT